MSFEVPLPLHHSALAALIALSVTGCEPDVGNHPVNPGCTGITCVGRRDASIGDIPDAGPATDALVGIVGRLCEADNLVDPLVCPTSTALGNVLVTQRETGESAGALANGNFALPADPDHAIATLRAARGDNVFRASIAPFALSGGNAGPVRMPIVREEDWTTLRLLIGAGETPRDAALLLYVLAPDQRGELVPQAGATLAPPEAGAEIYYDNGDNGQSWDQDIAGTGAGGTVLIYQLAPDLQADPDLAVVDLVVTLGAREKTLTDVPIAPDTVTFVAAVFD